MQVKRVIPLFEYMYPNVVAKFIFDQSSAHGAFAPDALNAKEMNVNTGEKSAECTQQSFPMMCLILQYRVKFRT